MPDPYFQNATAVLVEADPDTVREMQRFLRARGLDAHVQAPQQKCSSCGTKLWLTVAPDEVQRGIEALGERWAVGLDADAVRAAENAVDLDAEEATCPACGAGFAPSAGRCTACGLRLG